MSRVTSKCAVRLYTYVQVGKWRRKEKKPQTVTRASISALSISTTFIRILQSITRQG